MPQVWALPLVLAKAFIAVSSSLKRWLVGGKGLATCPLYSVNRPWGADAPAHLQCNAMQCNAMVGNT